jgi:hypothetical protein
MDLTDQPRSDAVERFLATGEHDRDFRAWPGPRPERRAAGAAALSKVLRRVVDWRARHAPLVQTSTPRDVISQVRSRIAPLITGLFRAERAALLLERLPARVEVLTARSLAQRGAALPLDSQWLLANLLLDDMGAPPLADDTPQLDGMCADGRAWVLPRAFAPGPPFTDVIVHEIAHLLHTLSPHDLGIGTSSRPLLRVAARDRETFAYAVEVWACVSRASDVHASRWESIQRVEQGIAAADARVDRGRLLAVLAAAVQAGDDGWGTIRGALCGASRQLLTT